MGFLVKVCDSLCELCHGLQSLLFLTLCGAVASCQRFGGIVGHWVIFGRLLQHKSALLIF